MSVRQEQPQQLAGAILPIGDPGAAPTESLGEGNSFAVATPDHPLKRIVAVSIKASLNELCLQKARGTWAPSQEALRNIFQQKKRVCDSNQCTLPSPLFMPNTHTLRFQVHQPRRIGGEHGW